MSFVGLIDTIHATVIRTGRRFFVSTRLMNSPMRCWLAGLNRSLARWRLSGRHTEASQVHGHVFFLPPGDHVGAMMYRSGNFEPETTILWQNLASPGMTVVDLGAYVGYFTLLACRQLEERGRVYAFEPQSLAREVLEKNIAANGYQSLVTVVP